MNTGHAFWGFIESFWGIALSGEHLAPQVPEKELWKLSSEFSDV